MPLVASDDQIRDLLTNYQRIAVVGMSNRPDRPSYGVARFLQQQGYRLYLVNPLLVGQKVLGLPVYATLADSPEAPEIVDVFRRSEFVTAVADAAIAASAKVLWTQLGVRDETAAERASRAGLLVVQDHCTAIEHRRLQIPQKPMPQ